MNSETSFLKLVGILIVIFILLIFFTPVESLAQDEFTIEPAGHFGGKVTCSAVQGNYAFLGQGRHLTVLEVSESGMKRIGSLELKNLSMDIALIEGYAFVFLNGDSGLQVIDISNPEQPIAVGFADVPGNFEGKVVVYGNYLYVVTSGNGLHIFNISNPSSPKFVTTFDDQQGYSSLFFSDTLAFAIRSSTFSLKIINVRDPENPVEIGSLYLPGGPLDVSKEGDFAYVTVSSDKGMRVIDVSDPQNPVAVAFVETKADGQLKEPRRVTVKDNYAYVACKAGAWCFVFDVSNPTSPTEVGSVKIETNFGNPESMQIDVNYLYVGLNWTSTPLFQLDVSAPTNPAIKNKFEEPYMVYDTHYHNDYLYSASQERIWVYDISVTPENPVLAASFTEWTEISWLFFQNNVLYALKSNMLVFIDASDPQNLTETGNYPFAGNYKNDVCIAGNYAYISVRGTNLEIVDLSDLVNPVKVGDFVLPGDGRDIVIDDSRKLVYIGYDTGGGEVGVLILDVTDPTNPTEVSRKQSAGQPMCIWANNDTLLLGSNTINGDDYIWHLEMFDVSDSIAPTLLAQVSDDGAIWDVQVESGHIFTGIKGGSVVVIAMYIDPQTGDLVIIAECHSPNTTGLTVTPPSSTGSGTTYTTEGDANVEQKYPSPDEGVVIQTYRIPPSIKGELYAVVRPDVSAGVATPSDIVRGPLGSLYPVSATPAPGWAWDHWVNATPAASKNASAVLAKPATQAQAWFQPILTLSEGPKNPGYQAVCPPKDPVEKTNTPIIQIILSASVADDWDLGSVTFQTEGSGTAEDVRMTKLRLNDSSGVVLDSSAFGGNISFNIPSPYNKLKAGASITLMVTYDFKYKEPNCDEELKEFYSWTNRDNIGAVASTYPPGVIYPLIPPAPIKTVIGGPAVLGCVHNINTKEIFTSIQKAIDDENTLDGHTILVCPGTYIENVDVTKSLMIKSKLGADETFVDAASTDDHVFHVQKNNVVLKGFTISNAGGAGNAGIYLEGSSISGCEFLENIIAENNHGIYVKNTGNNIIKGNIIVLNPTSGITLEGPNCHDNKIEKNMVGTDETDSQGFGNQNGITIQQQAHSNYIGSSVASLGNIISGNMESGILIDGEGTKANKIWANFVGTNIAATKELPNKYGVRIWNSADSNYVGGASADKRNIISGNTNIGVLIEGTGTQDNLVIGNYIGTNKAGTDSIKSKYGVFITNNASSNYVGGKTVNERNIISGNSQAGVVLDRVENNFVTGNYIGTTKDGTGGLPNKYGVYLQPGGKFNVIGGMNENERNVISGNNADGVALVNVESNMVLGNFIGTTKNGDKPLPNGKSGVILSNGATENWIGTYEGGGNVISGNKENGILLMEFADENEIVSNYIGTDKNASKAVPNEGHGIKIFRTCEKNHIGGKLVGEKLQLKGNVISGNKKCGISIEAYGLGEPSHNYVLDNKIGTNEDGTFAIANEEHGIQILDGANFNWIGSLKGGGNIISGNKKNGILVKGYETWHNAVLDNYIGTKKFGEEALPNEENGIELADKAKLSWIGGDQYQFKLRLKRNVISGNKKSGIWLHDDDTEKNYILSNYVGTNKTGTKRIENREYGIKISGSASGNWVGTYKGGGNLISGNRKSGVLISGKETDRNEILDNFIGTNITGMDTLPNYEHGVEIVDGPFATRIGGYVFDDHARGNLISGNKKNGVLIKGKSPDNDVMANYIGTNLDLSGKLPNGQNGIEVNGNALSNTIGSYVHFGNVIGGNGWNGIFVVGPKAGSTRILKNFIGTDMDCKKDLGNTKYGVFLDNGSIRSYVERNRIWHNYGAVWDSGLRSFIKGNSIKYNTHNTGIHLDNSIATIVGNDISDDEGDGIVCENGSTPIIKKNNIYINQGYGINNLDPNVTINAQDNWWGDVSGPGGSGPGNGDEINGVVDYYNWRESLVDLVVAPGADTLFIANGQADSIGCSFVNWQNPSDVLDVNISENQGWLISSSNVQVNLVDSLRSDIVLVFNIPENISMGTTNNIKITAVSYSDLTITDTDSFIIYLYDQSLVGLEVSPDSVKLQPGEKYQFSATGYDSLTQSIDLSVIWSASGGVIDSSGMFTAGNDTGYFYIYAEDPINHFRDSTGVTIYTITNVESKKDQIFPTEFRVFQNYPNPFNPETTIHFNVAKSCLVEMFLFDVNGRQIAVLVKGEYLAGQYEVKFSAENVPSGLYFYTTKMGDYQALHKMIILK